MFPVGNVNDPPGVIPAKAGIQRRYPQEQTFFAWFCPIVSLDSGFRRNDTVADMVA
jgi:hypothetical protein